MLFSSFYCKQRAREALKTHWLNALLIALIVNLPSLLVQGIAAVTGNDLMTRVQEVMYASINANATAVDMDKLLAGLEGIEGSTGIWVMQGLNIVAWLLTPCLTLGMAAWLLGRLRKAEDPGVSAVFGRMNLFFKGIGLRLYAALRIFLWMLPGIALSVLAWLPVWTNDGSSRISALSAVNTSMGLQTAAMVVTIALGVMAALKYALGDMILADHPDYGPIQAAKASKQMTRGRRGPLFSLYISFIFWYFLEMAAGGLCLQLFGEVASLMVQMLASLAITVYLTGSVSAFYLSCSGQAEQTNGAEENQEFFREGDMR